MSARDRRLDELVAVLASRGDHRSVIRLVETWASAGNPTRKARHHQARAFFALRLMDRAMARAREVAETQPEDAESQQLLAEIYLERGWPSHGRKILAQLREKNNSPVLEELWRKAQAEPARLAPQAREIEGSGDPAALLTLVEYFLTTGSFFRARSILERLRRMEPDNRRVQELLWGLDGNFSSRDVPVEKLLEELGGGVMASEMPEEPEHTETAKMDSGEEVATGFPSLFKAAPQGHRHEESDERTSFSPIATREQMAASAESTDPGREAGVPAPLTGRGEDTQIMLVLRPGEGGRSKPLHKKKEDDTFRETLNLRDWQASMGVAPAEAESQAQRLEEEDENVVMLNKSSPAPEPAPEPSETRHRPMEVIEKIPSPPPEPSQEVEPQPPEPTDEGERTSSAGQTPDLSTVTKVAALLVLLMALAFAAVIAGVFYLQQYGH